MQLICGRSQHWNPGALITSTQLWFHLWNFHITAMLVDLLCCAIMSNPDPGSSSTDLEKLVCGFKFLRSHSWVVGRRCHESLWNVASLFFNFTKKRKTKKRRKEKRGNVLPRVKVLRKKKEVKLYNSKITHGLLINFPHEHNLIIKHLGHRSNK